MMTWAVTCRNTFPEVSDALLCLASAPRVFLHILCPPFKDDLLCCYMIAEARALVSIRAHDDVSRSETYIPFHRHHRNMAV